jgi:hypothetical protein
MIKKKYNTTHSSANANDAIAFRTEQRTCEAVTNNFSLVVKRETRTTIKHEEPNVFVPF